MKRVAAFGRQKTRLWVSKEKAYAANAGSCWRFKAVSEKFLFSFFTSVFFFCLVVVNIFDPFSRDFFCFFCLYPAQKLAFIRT